MRAEDALKGSITKMRFPDYFRQLVIRSGIDAWGVVVGQKPTAICIATGVAALTLFFYWQRKGFDQMSDALFAIGATVASTVVVAILFFCAHLFFLSPKKLCEERETEIEIVEADRDRWRAEAGRKTHEKELRSTLYKIRDLIVETRNEPLSKKYDSFGALLRYADELSNESDVDWICSELAARGHDHPFGLFDLTSNHSCAGLRLSLLQEARASSANIMRAINIFSFAAKLWSHKDRYLKGRAEYAGWEVANPRPDGISLLPNIDPIKEPEPPEKVRDEVCLKLARFMEAGRQIMVDVFAKDATTKAEEWAKNAENLIWLVAGEMWAAKFRNDVGIPPPSDAPDDRIFWEQRRVYDFLYSRIYRLNELLEKVETGAVVPFSKPIS